VGTTLFVDVFIGPPFAAKPTSMHHPPEDLALADCAQGLLCGAARSRLLVGF
jgi:hypothetical protein